MGKNVIISTLPNISQNYLPKVNTSNIFANSLVYDDGSSVLINTTTASAFRLDVNGTGRFQGALTGTSATFSGSLIVGTGTTGTQYFANASAEISYSATTGLWRFNNLAGGSAPTTYYQFAADGTPILSILKSGAATFSGTGSFKSLGAAADVFTLGYSGAAVNMLQVYELSGGTNTEFNLRNSSGTSINRLSTNGNSFFNGGNVGIGTTSPAKVLDVYSSATNNTAQIVVSDASSTNRLYLGTFSNGSYISCGGTYSSGWSANGTNAIANIGMSASNGASTIQFETSTTNGAGPTERMRITSAGDMYLTGRSTNGDYGMYFYSNDTDSRIYSSNSGAVSKSLIFYTSGNPRMTITSGGNVQITVPSSTTQGILFKDVGGTSRGKVYYGDVSGEMYFGTMTGYSTVFVTNDTERMRITSGGNVGVGLTSPVVKLDVDGSVYSRGNLGASNGTQSTNTTSAVLYLGNRGYFTSADTGAAQIQAITSSPNWYSGTSLAFFTNPGPDVTATSAVERMRITSNGNINFNDTVYNNTAVATTRTLYIGSDYRIGGISSIRASKKNIENVSNINWLYQLNPVTFNYRKKDNDGKYTDEIYDELNYGLIAEDTAPIADFLINYNDKEDGTKEMIGIEYHRLITPLLKAIQELNQKITLLENK